MGLHLHIPERVHAGGSIHRLVREAGESLPRTFLSEKVDQTPSLDLRSQMVVMLCDDISVDVWNIPIMILLLIQ